ncbi:MAG: rane fusion protein multidrug efflux system [Campylobacterota bacterium]|nr:rane fusion protein multidrug efflux system [Campylobacterota bacterium]
MKKFSIIVVTALLFFGCSDDKKTQLQPQQQAPQMPPLSVKVHKVTIGKESFSKSYSAILKPYMEVDIMARVSGYLIKQNFTEGAFVKKGDVLYELQKDEFGAALNEAKASLLKSEANYNKALRDWQRAEMLYKSSAISAQQKDDVFYAYESAKAAVQEAKAQLQNAELNYGYTTIRAPISGIVGLSSSDEGSYINTDSANAKLSTVTSIDLVHAEFSIPNSDIAKHSVQVKNKAAVTLKIGQKTYKGAVDFIAPKVDAQTDTLLLRAKFDNKDKELFAGSYAEVALDGFGYESVAKIPQNALIKTPDATMVYVVENGTAVMKPLKIASMADGMAFIDSGLEESQSVIVSNIAKLRPNSKVKIEDGE